MAVLETVSGHMLDPLNPDPKLIDINDIAWALSRIPRFGGHTIPLIPYSVAQHSVCVMRWIDDEHHGNPYLMFHGLMHDAAEAYCGDLISPIKHIPEIHKVFSKIENSLMDAIYSSLHVKPPSQEEQEVVHKADMTQRSIEAYNFMNSRGRDWGLPKVSFRTLQEFEAPKTSTEAYEEFMQCFNELIDEVKE